LGGTNNEVCYIPGVFALLNVFKSFDGKTVIEDFTLTIAPGKTTVLIGPSGCGKSTVFGLMTGLLKPEKGTVTFEGQPLNKANLPSVRRRIGYVVQDGGLFPHLTCLGNISLVAKQMRWDSKKIENRVDELATITRLSPDLLIRYPAELSGGQRQRVSLMRALMLDANVLLLDEPLGALDPMVRAELQDDLMAVFRRLSKTVVMVTHDLNEAEFFADQIVLMRAGRIVQIGTADDLFDRPADPFTTQFVRAQQQRVPSQGLQ
jgi:osmoprotectant transport system ATP-binding protein